MSDLPIKAISIEQALNLNGNFNISVKFDGTLIYFTGSKLLSPRGIDRSDRFPHILNILKLANFPECYGEMYCEFEDRKANVFDISSKENWKNALYMPIDLLNSKLPYFERQKIIQQKVSELSSESITQMIRFSSLTEGWNYVLENEEEGLVLRNDREFYKIKVLHEAKVKIKSHEAGKNKGTFILENDNRVSGTSMEFVLTYLKAKEQGKEVFAEIEFPFITKENKYFQPRLRRIFEDG